MQSTFSTKVPELSSASCGAASPEPRWPVKSEWRTFPPGPCSGMSMCCAVLPRWVKGRLRWGVGRGLNPHGAGHFQYAAATPRTQADKECRPHFFLARQELSHLLRLIRGEVANSVTPASS